jgi:hypothetical protein
LIVARDFEPRFVDERGGLKRLARILVGKFVSGKAAEFVVNDREQIGARCGLAVLQSGSDIGDVVAYLPILIEKNQAGRKYQRRRRKKDWPEVAGIVTTLELFWITGAVVTADHWIGGMILGAVSSWKVAEESSHEKRNTPGAVEIFKKGASTD